jgi:hypothetical protein
MMSRLNVASWTLLAGAIGQSALYSVLFTRLPPWTIFVVLFPPWLIVYTISFCRQAPLRSSTIPLLLGFRDVLVCDDNGSCRDTLCLDPAGSDGTLPESLGASSDLLWIA